MTVHEAHKEYNSLIDQIQAKYKLLDSGECGSVDNDHSEWLPHYLIRSRSHCDSNFNSKGVVVRRNNPK